MIGTLSKRAAVWFGRVEWAEAITRHEYERVQDARERRPWDRITPVRTNEWWTGWIYGGLDKGGRPRHYCTEWMGEDDYADFGLYTEHCEYVYMYTFEVDTLYNL